MDLSVSQNMQALTGQIQRAIITIGNVPINITGTYQTSGPTTALNLQVSSQGASIDELQDFLPSVGVKLPTGSRLQGGTLTTNLNVTGSSASPIITGPIRIDNTNLAGFDLGSKLSAVTALTGAKTGSATAIKSLSTNLRVANGDVRTDNLSIVVPALGTATGAGTVAASGALNYQVILKLTGIPGGSSGGSQAAGVGGIAGQLMGMIPSGRRRRSSWLHRRYRRSRLEERHPRSHRRDYLQSNLRSQPQRPRKSWRRKRCPGRGRRQQIRR